MFDKSFKKPLIVAAFTVLFDFLFHFFLTNPMESMTYFVVKFLLSFFAATALFSFVTYIKKTATRIYAAIITSLIFSALMSIYYRAWELEEAYVPFGSRAPSIIGISRDNIFLFSGTWWLGHTLFFASGVFIANSLIKNNDGKKRIL